MFKFLAGIKGLFSSKVIKGTSGDDTIVAPPTNNIVKGKAGDDALNGGNGNDIVLGGAGNDDLGGGAGKDIVFGGAGNDVIRGGTSKDLLIGGSGKDLIVAGSGDVVWGGSGADVFRVDPTGVKNVLLDFDFREGDRIDIPPGYSLDNSKIVDNGLSIFGVTVTFFDDMGVAGPVMQINGVGNPSQVVDDWFI